MTTPGSAVKGQMARFRTLSNNRLPAVRSQMKITSDIGFHSDVELKVRKSAKIRNRYNQAPHLTQDTNGKVTTSQLDITNESQEVNPFPASDHKASTNRRAVHESITKQDRNNINDPQKKNSLGAVSKIFYWRA